MEGKFNRELPQVLLRIKPKQLLPNTCFSNLCLVMVSWCHVYLWTPVAFLSGLILSQRVVSNPGIYMFMAFLEQEKQTVTEAAVTVNSLECLSAILILLMAHIADARIGRFKVIAFATPSTFVGLMVLWLHPSFSGPPLYVGLVLLMVGKASYDPPLKGFVADQRNHPVDNHIHIRGNDMVMLEARRQIISCARGQFISFVVSFIFSVILGVTSWQTIILIVAIMMGIAYIQFWCGYNVYSHKGKRHGSPLTLICNQLKAAILRTVPNTWLDSSRLQEQEEVAESERVKQLIALVPMWTCFTVLGLIRATGSTFYTMQVSNKVDHSNVVNGGIIIVFYMLKDITGQAVSISLKFFISKYWSTSTRSYQHATLLQIGIGMLFCVLCCVTAWRVEVELLISDKQNDPDSILWLWFLPQFFLLGVMDGLAVDGLAEFFEANVDESIPHYKDQFNECALATGKLLGTVLILLNPAWFGDDIKTCHLDRYFLLLLKMSAVNLLWYVLVAYKYVSSSSVDVSSSSVEVSSSSVDLEVGLADLKIIKVSS